MPANLLTNARAHLLRDRLLQAVPVLVVATFIVFTLLHLTPGDPAIALAGEAPSPAHLAEIRQFYGLDQPFIVQYGLWLWNAAHADLGHSMFSGEPVVIGAISWFGETGPYRDFAATEAVCRALAGGVHAIEPAEGPPLIPLEGQSGVIAGLATFVATASGLYGGGGRRFSVSVQEALMHAMEMDFSSALATGKSRERPGVNDFGRHYPSSIYQTADGWIGISTITPAQWRGFCAMTGRMDLAADPRFASSEGRTASGLELERIFLPLLRTRTSLHWFEAGLKHRLALVIVPSMSELLSQPVHRERGAFVPVRIGEAQFDAPILPQRLGPAGPLPGGAAPLPGADNGGAFEPRERAPTVGQEMPLAGVRIVDLTMGWAGPLATRLLGDLGAEIIKVESCVYPDWWRGSDRSARYFAERQYERNNNYNMMNRNKLGITLDLTRPEGVAALQQLIAGAHGLFENYAADVLPKLGLTYETLRQTRPDLVMVSMSAYGADNAWSGMRAYGGTLEQGSGLPSVSGEEGWPPTMSAYAYGDPVSGFHGASAMLAGLLLQKAGAGGRCVNLSQIEGMLTLVAPKLIEQSLSGRVAPRLGNRHPNHVPHGCSRCAGADEWVVVTVTDAAEWQGLCKAIGRGDLAADPALATAAGRRQREDELEQAIAADERAAGAGSDAAPAGQSRARRRRALGDRPAARRPFARARVLAGARAPLRRQLRHAERPVPRDRRAVCDPPCLADARAGQHPGVPIGAWLDRRRPRRHVGAWHHWHRGFAGDAFQCPSVVG